MSAERDVTPIVRTWLQDGVTSLPDHVLDRVFDQVPAIRQERGWLVGRRNPAMHNALKLALAAAAVVAVVVAGLNLVPRSESAVVGQASTPAPSKSPSSTEPASVRAEMFPYRFEEPTVQRRAPARLVHVLQRQIGTRFLNDTWHDSPAIRNVRVLLSPRHDVFRSMWPSGGRPAGRTDRRRSRAGSSRDSEHLDDRASRFDDCRRSRHVPGNDPRRHAAMPGRSVLHLGWGLAQGPGQIVRTWVLEVDGSRLVVSALRYPEATGEMLAEQQSVLDSLQFE